MLFRLQTVEAVQGGIRGFSMQATLIKHFDQRSRHQRNTDHPEYCDVHLKPSTLVNKDFSYTLSPKNPILRELAIIRPY